jgi:hypothetical protein
MVGLWHISATGSVIISLQHASSCSIFVTGRLRTGMVEKNLIKRNTKELKSNQQDIDTEF